MAATLGELKSFEIGCARVQIRSFSDAGDRALLAGEMEKFGRYANLAYTCDNGRMARS
jgi:hypothetical protein